MEDTIFAQATARGKAGVAIVRLSGPNAIAVLEALGGTAPSPRSSRLCRLTDASGDVLDQALVLRFAAGASFTGEDVVELHLHGSMAVVRAVLRSIEATGLARSAEPGEFTRRALLNDRLDISRVQGLGDLIEAETEAQRRQAMRVFSGAMAEAVAGWRANLLRATALLEATIDFADEDVPVDVRPEVRSLLDTVARSLRTEVAGAEIAGRLRAGFEVALVGPPNVGKSSLLNRLTRHDAAIVSDRAGTTRDVIEVRLDVGGLPVTFLDMAGLRETDDAIEALGIEMALRRARDADLRLFLVEGDTPETTLLERSNSDLVVRTKTDLHGGSGVSSVTGDGVDALLRVIESALSTHASRRPVLPRRTARLAR